MEHFPDLSTPDEPAVPKEERDRPNDPETIEKVLSRDGFFCKIPGCSDLAEQSHHIRWREHGGRTLATREAGLCRGHHDQVHDGLILLSGTAEDLRISDRNRRPLQQALDPEENPVEIRIEPGGDPAEPDDPPPPAFQPPAFLPPAIDREFWLSHRHLFEWSERRKALIYHPEWAGEVHDVPQTAPEVPSPPPSGGLRDFLGERRIVENLALAIQAAKIRGGLPPHILLTGLPGLGKTTLAKLVAQELGAKLHQGQGPSLQDVGSLVGILLGLEKGAVLFIDELHGIPRSVAECFYQALDDGALSLPVIQGPRTGLVKLEIEPILLIGATTEESLLPKPLRSRFGIAERLDLYPLEVLEPMAVAAGRSQGVEVTSEGARTLARGSRGTPRMLLFLLGRALDLAQVERASLVTGEIACRALERQGIDSSGLSETDRKILRILLSRGRPVGLRSLADLLGESPRTLAEVLEPHLLREGWIPTGRRARPRAGLRPAPCHRAGARSSRAAGAGRLVPISPPYASGARRRA